MASSGWAAPFTTDGSGSDGTTVDLTPSCRDNNASLAWIRAQRLGLISASVSGNIRNHFGYCDFALHRVQFDGYAKPSMNPYRESYTDRAVG